MIKERDGAAVVVVQPSRERGHKNQRFRLSDCRDTEMTQGESLSITITCDACLSSTTRSELLFPMPERCYYSSKSTKSSSPPDE